MGLRYDGRQAALELLHVARPASCANSPAFTARLAIHELAPAAALRYNHPMRPAPDVLEQLRELGYRVETEEQALAACELAYGMLADQARALLYGPPRIRR